MDRSLCHKVLLRLADNKSKTGTIVDYQRLRGCQLHGDSLMDDADEDAPEISKEERHILLELGSFWINVHFSQLDRLINSCDHRHLLGRAGIRKEVHHSTILLIIRNLERYLCERTKAWNINKSHSRTFDISWSRPQFTLFKSSSGFYGPVTFDAVQGRWSPKPSIISKRDV